MAATEDEYREPAGDNSQELLAARGQTVHNEAAALGPAAVKSEFVIAISSGNLSSGVLFKMVKHDLAGQSLLARVLRSRASECPVVRANGDALVNRDG